ncbi:MAG: hypothetical protein WDW38_007436 [Sanguina aurantia]
MNKNAYDVLGLAQNANREQAETTAGEPQSQPSCFSPPDACHDAWRSPASLCTLLKLCLTHHPDKCAPDTRAASEVRFREVKAAYDAILRGQAGYSPPPPGTNPSSAYARAYSQAHGGADFDGGGPGAPVRMGGPYGGYATERDFYKAMFRRTRNNPFILIVAGLLMVPGISVIVAVANGNTGFIERFRNEGINMYSQAHYQVNGRTSLNNPFSIGSMDNAKESYIYKSEKFKHLRPDPQNPDPATQ